MHKGGPMHHGKMTPAPTSLPMPEQVRTWYPYISPHDPCPPMKEKTYWTPPHLFMRFQPPNLEKFEIHEALRRGTLWKALYSPYNPRLPH